jgi:imidazoleglycerol phosphate dehydratase HisB
MTNVNRTGTIERTTRETRITATVRLDGAGVSRIATGLGFLDHMLTALASHSRIDIDLTCDGDLAVDDHHTVEDCALAIGSAIDKALGDRRGIVRFGYAYAPLDEALARVVIDLSGRPSASVDLALTRERIGDVATENISHVFVSMATALRCAIHADVLRGDNDHHKAEAAFKALALALRQAVAVDPTRTDVPSTKGTLS